MKNVFYTQYTYIYLHACLTRNIISSDYNLQKLKEIIIDDTKTM